MEEKLKSSSKFLILPHCHLYANFFPDDFKGKIIHVTRDPRAVITSAWHFMTKLPHYNHYFETWVRGPQYRLYINTLYVKLEVFRASKISMTLPLTKQGVKCTGVILSNSITAGKNIQSEIQMLILFS